MGASEGLESVATAKYFAFEIDGQPAERIKSVDPGAVPLTCNSPPPSFVSVLPPTSSMSTVSVEPPATVTVVGSTMLIGAVIEWLPA